MSRIIRTGLYQTFLGLDSEPPPVITMVQFTKLDKMVIKDWREEAGLNQLGLSDIMPKNEAWLHRNAVELWITAERNMAGFFWPEMCNIVGRYGIQKLTTHPKYAQAFLAQRHMLRRLGTWIRADAPGIDRFSSPKYKLMAVHVIWRKMHIEWPDLNFT